MDNPYVAKKIDDKELAQKNKIKVKIYAPFKVYYDGMADSVSASNDTGPFDVLPMHHKFISLLKSCDLIVRDAKKEHKFAIDRGVMHVSSNNLTVFLDI